MGIAGRTLIIATVSLDLHTFLFCKVQTAFRPRGRGSPFPGLLDSGTGQLEVLLPGRLWKEAPGLCSQEGLYEMQIIL